MGAWDSQVKCAYFHVSIIFVSRGHFHVGFGVKTRLAYTFTMALLTHHTLASILEPCTW